MRAMSSFLQDRKPGKVMFEQAIEPAIDSGVLCLKPVIIDNLYGMYKDVFRALAA